MLFVNASEVHANLDYAGLVEALRTVFRDGVDILERFSMSQVLPDGRQNDWLLLPAWQFDRFQGIKLVSVFPQNESRGLPSVQGIYILLDGTTGLPTACIDGTALTLRKTAANSALAATYLARQDCKTLLMVGAGALASHLIQAHCTVRPSIDRVLIWNRNIARAVDLANELSPRLQPLTVEASENLELLVRQSDVISCATMTSAPLIKGNWLLPGTHLDLVGGYRPGMREADDDAICRARVFVDARFNIEECGDLSQPISNGILLEHDITDTFQLARGSRTGRQTNDEITLFKSGGGGHEDLATAQYLLSKL